MSVIDILELTDDVLIKIDILLFAGFGKTSKFLISTISYVLAEEIRFFPNTILPVELPSKSVNNRCHMLPPWSSIKYDRFGSIVSYINWFDSNI